MKSIITATLVALAIFAGAFLSRRNTILTAEPWVDTERNVILISFNGDVHEYEYWEE